VFALKPLAEGLFTYHLDRLIWRTVYGNASRRFHQQTNGMKMSKAKKKQSVNIQDFDGPEETETEEEFEEGWKKGKTVKVDINLGLTTVLSVRMPKTMLTELTEAAKELDIAPATFARQAIEEKIATSEKATASQLARVVARLAERVERLTNNSGAA